jgi:hypothetical protein
MGCYSSLVITIEAERIMGAASTTTGSIVIQEMIQASSQCVRNWLIVRNGKLAIPAAIRHVNPA